MTAFITVTATLYFYWIVGVSLSQLAKPNPNRVVAGSHQSPKIAAVVFTETLDKLGDQYKLIQALRRACHASNVIILDAQLSDRPAKYDALARRDLVSTLRGTFPDTKVVIKDLLERFGTASVRNLRMRTLGQSGGVETNLTISVWSSSLAFGAEHPSQR